MKYQDMNEEQKKEYSKKQVERQRKARHLAKANTTILRLEISNCPEDLMNAILAAIKEGK